MRVENSKIAYLWRSSYSLVQTLAVGWYRLATIHFVTDRQTDIVLTLYDRLKTESQMADNRVSRIKQPIDHQI